ncbi:Programmed cell death protein 4 [Halotydeus destructor]|nr:Programmed cell death protein 4 [Halotydeus destructor]
MADSGDFEPSVMADQQVSYGDDDNVLMGDKTDLERVHRKAVRPSSKIAGSPKENVGRTVQAMRKVNVKNNRRSRGRFGRGLTKKGGAGGKGTWGKAGSELVGVELNDDPRDPNYDSDSLENENIHFEAITPPLNEDEVEQHVAPIISEYFEHGDTEEVIYSLEELNLQDNEYRVLVIAVTLAMERKNAHRELTSVLISDMYNRTLVEEEMERGFDVLLKSLPDLVLDTPTATDVLGSFIARAVADDCIPPKFVNRYKGAVDNDQMPAAIDHASALLNMKHGLVKLDTVWGVAGGMRPVKYLIRQMQLLLREYLSSGVRLEAVRCLQELEVPHFLHEFVYESVIMAIEDGTDKTMDLICSLLKELDTTVVVTRDQLKSGFLRICDELPDISIDVPHAFPLLEKFVAKCDEHQLMFKELKELPQRGRKRFVSEGDGGVVKEQTVR